MKRAWIVPVLIAVLLWIAACNIQSETPVAEVIALSVPTGGEYRTGPGDVYEIVGTLDAGQQVEAVGVSLEGDYWLIRDPQDPTSLVWLEAASVIPLNTGISLPIATPPATPTPVEGGVPPLGCPSPVPSGPTPISCEPVAPVPGGLVPADTPLSPLPVPASFG